jgi:hypothetical protein
MEGMLPDAPVFGTYYDKAQTKKIFLAALKNRVQLVSRPLEQLELLAQWDFRREMDSNCHLAWNIIC